MPRTTADWLRDLAPDSPNRAEAIQALRDYLLRAILVYLTRSRADLSEYDYDELRQWAEDWAQTALLQVIEKRESFRGDSKFTTWAYRVAVNLVASDLRRKAWSTASLEHLVEANSNSLRYAEDTSAPRPEVSAERSEAWDAVRTVIRDELTDRQRTAITRVILDGAPMEVVAKELGTNRNNLYKILHDARRKLKAALAARRWQADDILSSFAQGEAAD